jgi:hypothetical protein
LTQKMPQSIVLQQRLVALCQRSITLGAYRRDKPAAFRCPSEAEVRSRLFWSERRKSSRNAVMWRAT